MAVTNLGASIAPWFDVVDASHWGGAHCRSPLPAPLAQEMYRHVLRKTCWTRMLGRAQSWLRSHGILDPGDEMPGGGKITSSDVWVDLATSLPFEEVSRWPRGKPCHINIGEVRSYLAAEEKAAEERPGSRVLIGGDSQVTAGSVVKGRAASPAINSELRPSLAYTIGSDIVSGGPWLPSKTNVSDGPTRQRPCDPPSQPLPSWFRTACAGDFRALDVALKEAEKNDKDCSTISVGVGDALKPERPQVSSQRAERGKARARGKN